MSVLFTRINRPAAELVVVGLLSFACSSTTQYGPEVSSGAGAGVEVAASKPVHITDRHDERFDITHAVNRYNMRRRGFEFGIGKNTIRPLNQPRMLTSQDPGYPASGSSWNRGPDVIGMVIGDEARSYPVERLVRHEIVNDSVGHTQATVAY